MRSTIPLWRPTNLSMFSDVFRVPEGFVCLLFATGLEDKKVRTEQEFIVPQRICVRRVMHKMEEMKPSEDGGCGWVYSMDDVRVTRIEDEFVHTCNDNWTLTKCRNTGIIGIPGSYVLELNDATAIQEAQVYANLYGVATFPPQVADIFFN